MNLNLMNKRIYLLALSGIILYIVLIVIAMFTYPGGIRDNISIVGYSFWGNTFSDLGRVTAWNGDPNPISMILFSFAYGIHATTMIFFYLVFMQKFEGEKLEGKTCKIGSFFGVLSSIAIIGIIFTPADIFYVPHWIFVFIGYPSIFLMGLFYSITLFLSNYFSKNFSYIFTICLIVFFVALLVGLIGISISRTIMVIGQKIMRIALLIDLSILIYGAWKLEEKK
ncbi:MAG: hypothetical protein ACFE9Q_10435 [Candidatus Hodarchaeota archaeon]